MTESMQGVGSIKSRIAALNLEQVHAPAPDVRPSYSYEQAVAKKKAPPPPPPSQRPPVQQRGQTVNNPPVLSNATLSARQPANQPIEEPPHPPTQPALPPRPPPRTPSQAPPSLPPRKSSEHSIRRRESSESISTIASTSSAKTSMSVTSNSGTTYRVRAPPYDPTKLPPIFSKKIPDENKESATLKAMKSKSNLVQTRALPPQLPSRPAVPVRNATQPQKSSVQQEPCPVVSVPRRSALSFGLNKSTEAPPPIPGSRPTPSTGGQAGVPPPIPMGSRPNLQALMASKPKPGATASCLRCRDFSSPDSHAAQFPRRNLPGSDVTWLATQLTAPFPSPTDKARAIFTWLHHNIEYDVHSFFSGNISPSTPEGTINSGLAVCSGYSGLFAAVALKAGLQAVVISGHGKGFGHSPVMPGDPLPAFKCGHAWNAVQIDNGEWKLIDACWGAGHIGCPNRNEGYVKEFNASMFTMDNDEFGKKHFPDDNAYFFRTDGRPSISWEEYCLDDMGERVMVYGGATINHGIGERTFQPTAKHIKIHDPQQGPVVRFQFATVCPHWDNERHGKGKPYVMCLHVGGRDGRQTEWLPFNTDGKVWWLDVNRIELGAPGQKVSVFAVTTFDGRDGRGVSYETYKAKKGRVAMGFDGVAMWELL